MQRGDLHINITGSNADALRAIRGVQSAMRGFRTANVGNLVGLASSFTLTTLSIARLAPAALIATAAVSALSVSLAGLTLGAVGAAATVAAAGFFGLASAAGAATFAIGAFGLLAAPTIMSITDAYKDYRTAVDEATKAQKVGDTAGYERALKNQEKALALLNPAQRQTLMLLDDLRSTWRRTASALEPTTLSLMNGAFAYAAQLLPTLIPLARAAGNALSGLLERARAALSGTAFQSFMQAVTRTAPGIISQFGDVGFNLAEAIANGFIHGFPLIQYVMDALVRFSDKLKVAMAGPGFQEFIRFSLNVLPHAGAVFGAVGRAFLALLLALEPVIIATLDVVAQLFTGMTWAFQGSGMQSFIQMFLTLLPVLVDSIRDVVGMIGGLATAVAPLATVVLGAIGDLANGLEDIFRGDAFGGLVTATQSLVTMLVPLLTSVVQAIVSIATPLISALAPSLGVVTELVQSLGVSFTQVAGALGSGIASALGALAPALGAIASSLAGVLSNNVLPQLAETFVQLVAVAAPVIDRLIQGFGAIAPVLIETAGVLAGQFFTALDAIAPVVTTLLTQLAPIATLIGGFLVSALQMAAPLLQAFLTQLGPVLLSVLTTLQAPLTQLLEAFLGMLPSVLPLVPLLADLAANFVSLVTSALPLVTQLRGDLQPILGEIIQTLIDGAPAWTGLFQQLLTLLPTVAGLALTFAQLLPTVVNFATFLVGVFQPVLSAVGGILSDLVGWLGENQTAANTLFSAILIGVGIFKAAQIAVATFAGIQTVLRAASLASAAATWLFNGALLANPITWIVLAIVALIAAIVLLVQNWDTVVAALGKVWDWMKNLASWVADTFMAGWQAVADFFSGLGDKIVGWFSDAGSWLMDSGASIARGLWDGISNGAEQLWDWFISLPGKLLDLYADAGTWLLDVGKDILRGLWNGLKAVASGPIDFIKNLAGDMIDGFKNVFGINSPSRVMIENGEYTGQGIGIGLMRAQSGVKSAWNDTMSLLDFTSPNRRFAFAGAPGVPTTTGAYTGLGPAGIPANGLAIGTVKFEIFDARDPEAVSVVVEKKLNELLDGTDRAVRQRAGRRG